MFAQLFSYEIFHYHSRISTIILGIPSQLSCADFPYFFFLLVYSFVFDQYTSVATLVNGIESELFRLYMAEDVLIIQL